MPGPSYTKPTHTYGSEQGADTYDAMRAGSWDGLVGEQLPQLLGILGVGDKPKDHQQDVVRAWTGGPAYHAAPDQLKKEIAAFLAEESR